MIKVKEIFIFLFFITCPSFTQAAVIINEVAWMGSKESANHEWIELYNSGNEAVVVEGWTLEDGANLKIKLTGSISANSYAVLERTSDDSATGPAFLIYTGALINTGATLTLRNENGAIADQVFGGDSWQEIGGDNVTKETAQYTENGWVTDSPTPGQKNGSGRVGVVDEKKESGIAKSTTNNTKTTNDKTAIVISKTPPNSTSPLSLTVDAPEITFVNQKTKFTVIPKLTSMVQNLSLKSLIYDWNFGDAYVDGGRESEHIFSFPGSYVVTVSARVNGKEVLERKEIKVLPVSFSLTKNENGDLQINNNAPYAVDLSNYKIVGTKTVVFPENSAILPKSTVTIAKNRLLQKADELVVLYDALGNLVTSTWSKTNPFLEKATNNSLVVFSNESEIGKQGYFSESYIDNNLVVENKKAVNFSINNNQEMLKTETFGFAKNLASPTNEVGLITVSEDFWLENPVEDLVAGDDILITEEKSDKKSEEMRVEENERDENGYDNYGEKDNRWAYLALIGLLALALFGLYSGKKEGS